jgi:hypothetical protein
MKAKHKYILTLSTLALFIISVFIVYFISTRSISKAMLVEGGGGSGEGGDCPHISCTDTYKDCWNIICNNMRGVCTGGKCDWRECFDTNQCDNSYCCESEIPSSTKKQCFKEGIYTNNNYLCAPK